VPDIRLIVGLGNPGDRYAGTPHNIGFEVLDQLALRTGLRFRRAFGLQAWASTWQGDRSRVRLLKPRTFMNRSGVAVRKALRRWRIRPEELLLVYDEVSLPLGQLRIRLKGGAGGHNGVTSVISELDNLTDIPRLRVGVGPRPPGDQLVDYLLGPWDPQLRSGVQALAGAGASALEMVCHQGVEAAMNHWNSVSAETNLNLT
jgi:PTH1 family peptidyl-tRNA hydrolase